MFDKIKALFSKPAAPTPAVPKLAAKPDPRVEPGKRVYHEYFLEDEPRPQGWYWLCRVYARGGEVNERAGHEQTRIEAGKAAIAYAETTKAVLRGDS
jgi:hypothetical protein